jgi:hypothetical protein
VVCLHVTTGIGGIADPVLGWGVRDMDECQDEEVSSTAPFPAHSGRLTIGRAVTMQYVIVKGSWALPPAPAVLACPGCPYAVADAPVARSRGRACSWIDYLALRPRGLKVHAQLPRALWDSARRQYYYMCTSTSGPFIDSCR